jgi:hypothetical protein
MGGKVDFEDTCKVMVAVGEFVALAFGANVGFSLELQPVILIRIVIITITHTRNF